MWRSASRREQMPALAIIFWMRCSSGFDIYALEPTSDAAVNIAR
jgi:hypothetical protein